MSTSRAGENEQNHGSEYDLPARPPMLSPPGQRAKRVPPMTNIPPAWSASLPEDDGYTKSAFATGSEGKGSLPSTYGSADAKVMRDEHTTLGARLTRDQLRTVQAQESANTAGRAGEGSGNVAARSGAESQKAVQDTGAVGTAGEDIQTPTTALRRPKPPKEILRASFNILAMLLVLLVLLCVIPLTQTIVAASQITHSHTTPFSGGDAFGPMDQHFETIPMAVNELMSQSSIILDLPSPLHTSTSLLAAGDARRSMRRIAALSDKIVQPSSMLNSSHEMRRWRAELAGGRDVLVGVRDSWWQMMEAAATIWALHMFGEAQMMRSSKVPDWMQPYLRWCRSWREAAARAPVERGIRAMVGVGVMAQDAGRIAELGIIDAHSPAVRRLGATGQLRQFVRAAQVVEAACGEGYTIAAQTMSRETVEMLTLAASSMSDWSTAEVLGVALWFGRRTEFDLWLKHAESALFAPGMRESASVCRADRADVIFHMGTPHAAGSCKATPSGRLESSNMKRVWA